MNWYKKAISNEYPNYMKRRMPETDRQLYDYFHSDDPPKGEPMEEEFWEQIDLKPDQKGEVSMSKSHPLSGESWDIQMFNRSEQKLINDKIKNGLKKIIQNKQKIDEFSVLEYAPELIGIPITYIMQLHNELV